MVQTLLGIKKNMTSTYDARGRRVGATVLEITPNLVTQVKTTETKDGYNSVQLGMGTKKSVKKPQIGHLKKAGVETKLRWLREIKTQDGETLEPGTAIKLNQVFSIGDSIKVTGVSKGRGFQGGVRRHGFSGGPKTRGQSDRHRAPGSIGAGTTPGRVLKGKRMAGHMGSEVSAVKNLEVVGIDRENNLLTVKGGVPGHVGGLIMVTKLGRIRGYIPPPEPEPEEEETEQGIGNNEQSETNESIETQAVTESTESPVAQEGEENANS